METLSAESLNAQFKDKVIDLSLIDPPSKPTRKTMDDEDLARLGMNIKRVGLLKPIIVKPNLPRYEVVAGHRRFLACTIVEYNKVPCRIIVKGSVDPLDYLESENAHTEAVNAVEQAEWYQDLLVERCGNDVDALCIAVGRKREFIEDRLILLQGWPQVIEALREKHVSIAVARELNKVKDEARLRSLIDVSIAQGATARQVMEWRKQYEVWGEFGQPDAGSITVEPQPSPIAEPYVMRCFFCDGSEDPHMMEMMWMHKQCKRVVHNIVFRQPTEQG